MPANDTDRQLISFGQIVVRELTFVIVETRIDARYSSLKTEPCLFELRVSIPASSPITANETGFVTVTLTGFTRDLSKGLVENGNHLLDLLFRNHKGGRKE